MRRRPSRDRRKRRRFAVLALANVRRLLVGYGSSTLGTAMANVAVAFAILDRGGSAGELGLVFASAIVVEVVLMIAGGVLADRLGRRRVMIAADLLRTGSQGALAVLLFVSEPGIGVFIACAAARGAGDAVFEPAFTGLVVELADRAEVGDVNAVFGMCRSAATVVGPVLAGTLIAVADPATVIALDAGSFAISAGALGGLALRAIDRGRGTSIVSDLIEGWDTFRSRTWLWTVTVQFALFNLVAWGPFLLLGPVLSRRDLSGARSWGAILAAYALGSVLGGLAALGRRPRRPLVTATVGTLGYPVVVGLLAFGASTPEVVGGALIAGCGSATFNIFFAACIQREIPPDAQARVSAFDAVGSYSAGPIAFAAAGPVSELVGAHTVLAVGAGWSLVSTLLVVALPSVRAVRDER